MQKRDKLKEAATRNRTRSNWKAYRKSKNYVTYKIRKNKRRTFKKKIKDSQGNIKKTWKNLNILIPRKNKNTKIRYLKVGNAEIYDSKKISQNFE